MLPVLVDTWRIGNRTHRPFVDPEILEDDDDWLDLDDDDELEGFL